MTWVVRKVRFGMKLTGNIVILDWTDCDTMLIDLIMTQMPLLISRLVNWKLGITWREKNGNSETKSPPLKLSFQSKLFCQSLTKLSCISEFKKKHESCSLSSTHRSLLVDPFKENTNNQNHNFQEVRLLKCCHNLKRFQIWIFSSVPVDLAWHHRPKWWCSIKNILKNVKNLRFKDFRGKKRIPLQKNGVVSSG